MAFLGAVAVGCGCGIDNGWLGRRSRGAIVMLAVLMMLSTRWLATGFLEPFGGVCRPLAAGDRDVPVSYTHLTLPTTPYV